MRTDVDARRPQAALRYFCTRRAPLKILAMIVVMVCTACSTSPPSGLTAQGPLPAGRLPSKISKMVCAPEAQHEINNALGVTAVVASPTWSGHLYSCHYTYTNGSFALSVKELSSWAQTFAYFRSLESSLGNVTTLPNLGQGGYETRDGSVVVRKDWKVLLVNISGLPTQFGMPPTPAGNVAVTVADVILGCWSGD